MGKKSMKIVKIDFEQDTKAGYITRDSNEPRARIIEPPNSQIAAPLHPKEHPRCCKCATIDVDPSFYNTFDIKICKQCLNDNEEQYALLTKTECKKDYLLTEPELKSLKHIEKANPHRSHWFPMQLFVRQHVEAFAIEKWGSLEKMDEEFYTRETSKQARKEEKYTKNLNKLRGGIRTSEWTRKQDKVHTHHFEMKTATLSQCECGMTVEAEEF